MTRPGAAASAGTTPPGGGSTAPGSNSGTSAPLEATRTGAPVALGAARQRAVLALLLIHANEMVSAEQLVDGLWGAEPPSGAAHSVHVYVSGVRKVLELDRDPATAALEVVTQKPGSLRAWVARRNQSRVLQSSR